MSGFVRDPIKERRLMDCERKVVYRFRFVDSPADCIDQELPRAECCQPCKEATPWLFRKGEQR